MEALPKFEIEAVTSVKGNGALVFARLLDEIEFSIKSGLELNGCKIKSGNIPRALNNDGTPRLDLIGFQLQFSTDLAKFKVGDIVELTQ